MQNPQDKNSVKYVALAAYLVAVVCLLLGLFLPLWGDKGILALQLPDIFNKIANKDAVAANNEFALSHPVNFLGLGKAFDIMALVALLYVVVTAFSLLALIPVGIGTKKDSKIAGVFMYIVEIAAVIVTSLYVIIALQYQYKTELVPADASSLIFAESLPALGKFGYNMVIALGGSLIALIVHCILFKKVGSVVKIFLFLLSAIGLLALFNFGLIISGLAQIDKLAPALFGESTIGTGVNNLKLLFEGGFAEVLGSLDGAKFKAAMVFAAIVALIAVINYFIDVIGLSTNAGKSGHFFNVIRYGLEFIVAVCLMVTVAVCSYKFGIMLIALAVAVAAQLAISLIRLLWAIKKPKEESADDNVEMPSAEPVRYVKPEPVMAETERRFERNFDKPEPIMAEPEKPNDRPESLLSTPLRPFENIEPLVSETETDEPKNYQQPPEPLISEVREPQSKEDKYGFNETVAEEPVQMEIVDIEPEPVQPAAPVQPAEPVQPVRPAEPRYEERPVQPVPVQPSSPERANVGNQDNQTRIYTINTIYGGPVDDFMKKLSNDERIEFAMTFIEKSKGNIGNIPEYVIGGNNRSFFSSVFIYLGRIRGLISDGLLNKMYRELNML